MLTKDQAKRYATRYLGVSSDYLSRWQLAVIRCQFAVAKW